MGERLGTAGRRKETSARRTKCEDKEEGEFVSGISCIQQGVFLRLTGSVTERDCDREWTGAV